MDDFDWGSLSDLWDTSGNYIGDNASNLVTNDLTGTSSGGGSGSWFDTLLSGLKTTGVVPGLQTGAGLLTSALGGSAQTSSINKALAELKNAYGMASGTSAQQYDKAQAMIQPYREMGTATLPTFAGYAQGADTGRQNLGTMVNSGLYDWQAEQLNNQINKQLAARGRYDSGAGLKTLSDAQRALAAQESDKSFNRNLTLENMDYGRLLDATNIGMGAAGQGAGLATNQGTTQAGLDVGLGTSSAQGSTALGNATASMYGNANKSVQSGLSNLYAQLGF